MTNDNPIISLQMLQKSFPTPDGTDEIEVFGDVWFDVFPGEFVCLIGHSGCGKTTLLNIWLLYTSPSPRDVRRCGVPASA